MVINNINQTDSGSHDINEWNRKISEVRNLQLAVVSYKPYCLVWFMVFNATFDNISAITRRSVLLVEETGETNDMSQVTDKLIT